jgi:hypothetical protein
MNNALANAIVADYTAHKDVWNNLAPSDLASRLEAMDFPDVTIADGPVSVTVAETAPEPVAPAVVPVDEPVAEPTPIVAQEPVAEQVQVDINGTEFDGTVLPEAAMPHEVVPGT